MREKLRALYAYWRTTETVTGKRLGPLGFVGHMIDVFLNPGKHAMLGSDHRRTLRRAKENAL